MLKPAILYENELMELFKKEIYTKDYFHYTGYLYAYDLPEIKSEDHRCQFAIVDDNNESRVLGYLAYRIDALADAVYNFGLYSFDKGNLKVIKEVYEKLEELIKNHRRVEWRVIGSNPAKRGYDNFCKKHNGYISKHHAITRNYENDGYVDEYLYEILNNDRM